MPKTQFVPEAGDKFYPCLESEKVAGKIVSASPTRSLKPLTIKKVFHQTQVPDGLAPTWCVTVKENDTCYDAAWSAAVGAWVFGGANSGLNEAGKPLRRLVIK
jgi:hypothetical protein